MVIVADGGGLVAAARRPIEGAERVAGFLAGALDTAVSLAVKNGRITRIYAIRNPHKLATSTGSPPSPRT